MPKLTEKQLLARDAKRDLNAELLSAATDLAKGLVGRVHVPSESDGSMPAEIDFSKGMRGKFYRPDAKLNLPLTADCVLEKIKRADQRAKNEGTLTHEEAKQRLNNWLGDR